MSAIAPDKPTVAAAELRAAAMDYATQEGLHIFPCVLNGKIPGNGDGGFHHATNDPEQIEAWWMDTPSANVGWVPGMDGCIVIDFDPFHMVEDSHILLARLDREAPTKIVDTAGKGWHYVYRLPAGCEEIGNWNKTLPAGIDVRAHGGYVLLEPSQVVYRGKDAERKGLPDGYIGRYRVADDREPVEIPAWLLADILKAKVAYRSDGKGLLEGLTPSLEPPVLSMLAQNQREFALNPTYPATGRSERDGSFTMACVAARIGYQAYLDIFEHYAIGQNPDSRYQEKGRRILEVDLGTAIAKWEAAHPGEKWEEGPTEGENPLPLDGVAIADSVEQMLQQSDVRKSVWTTAELLVAEFPDPIWIVPEMLPVGLASLAGRPKLGKSWMGLQLAVAVGSGGVFLGKQVEKRSVLYLALEDGPQRLQSRLRQQSATKDTGITFMTEFPSLGAGGAKFLLDVTESKDFGLIVIDTFSKAAGRLDQMDLGVTGELLGRIQRAAIDNNILLLLVDHHRKSAGNGDGDPVDDVMGSTGKSAPLDVSIGLYRQRGQKDAILKITGRDIEEQELSVKFDRDTGCWQMVGTAHGVRIESLQGDIMNAIEENGGSATAAEIARFLGKQPNNISAELQEMVAKGAVVRGKKKGVRVPYSLPTIHFGGGSE